MAKLGVKQIQDVAINLVNANPGGIRYSELVRRVHGEHPETPKNTIHGSVWNLETRHPDKVSKPSRGLFVPTLTGGNGSATPPSPVVAAPKAREEDFYQPFADWLKSELDEATVAISLGGA